MAILKMVFFIGLLTVCGCQTNYPPMETVARVDVERYLGRWYEIARYPHRFEEGCSQVTAEYARRQDGSIKVMNRCVLEAQGGKVKKAEGRAKVVDSTSNAKLKVSFFWPFYGDYWIVELGDDYQYAIVAEPSRRYVWILARRPEMEEALYRRLVNRLADLGYDPRQLIKTRHGAR